jgi:hypothetical protein
LGKLQRPAPFGGLRRIGQALGRHLPGGRFGQLRIRVKAAAWRLCL